MNTKLIAAVILGSLMLAGCGGGSGDTARDEEMRVADQERIDELEEQLEEALDEAEQERLARETEQGAKEQASWLTESGWSGRPRRPRRRPTAAGEALAQLVGNALRHRQHG